VARASRAAAELNRGHTTGSKKKGWSSGCSSLSMQMCSRTAMQQSGAQSLDRSDVGLDDGRYKTN
jgi:hypothetical protein